MKRTIADEGRNLSLENKREIIRRIKQTHPETLKKSSNGTHVILNRLPEPIITEIYEFIKKSLNLV